ncbi:hypothetical protein BG011_007181 [Mortierella polycephala]|uniref:BHLH domain-containing protein n=1 Tax=Mortierella polycephala TaxID=41804 RepID=A0A9P6PT34_9FUNG|nr:hypothetical protein BG011_007181 [Mortierella polycephala]
MTISNSSSPTSHSKNVFRLHGVNVLNRKNVDSIARLTALERRRTTHILDERQRRDTMNQLLTELASLVRESAVEGGTIQQQQQQQQLQQQVKTQTPSTPTLNADGTEKRPPVKSNSITTLRNAIAEIRRLRAHIDLQAINDPDSNGSNHAFPPSRRSFSRSTSPSLSEYSSLSTLATLATQHRNNLDSNSGSCSSTPMSSPRPASQRALSPVDSSEVTLVDVTALPVTQTIRVPTPPPSPPGPDSATTANIRLTNARYIVVVSFSELVLSTSVTGDIQSCNF